MSNINNPFVVIDPAENATRQQKAEAFEWLRGIAVRQVGQPGGEHAAIMMHEILRLNSYPILAEHVLERLTENANTVAGALHSFIGSIGDIEDDVVDTFLRDRAIYVQQVNLMHWEDQCRRTHPAGTKVTGENHK